MINHKETSSTRYVMHIRICRYIRYASIFIIYRKRKGKEDYMDHLPSPCKRTVPIDVRTFLKLAHYYNPVFCCLFSITVKESVIENVLTL